MATKPKAPAKTPRKTPAKAAASTAARPAAKAVPAAVKPAAKPVAKPVAKPAAKVAQAAAPARLISNADLMGALDLADEFYAIAYNIETSLLNAGAKPGQDYNRLDLYKLAQPFVLELFKGDEKFSYAYPAAEVSKP